MWEEADGNSSLLIPLLLADVVFAPARWLQEVLCLLLWVTFDGPRALRALRMSSKHQHVGSFVSVQVRHCFCTHAHAHAVYTCK